MGNVYKFRRKRLPPIWTPYLRHRGWPAKQLRMTVWTRALLGLLVFQATRLEPATRQIISPAPPVERPSPYAEARRSHAILKAQEGAPAHGTLVLRDSLHLAAASRSGTETRGIGEPMRVIDGDTFEYGGVRVRVADIDTPEVMAAVPMRPSLRPGPRAGCAPCSPPARSS